MPCLCYYIYTLHRIRSVPVYTTNYTVDNCGFFGKTLSIYCISNNELMIPFCGFELFVLKRLTTNPPPPVEPYQGGYIDSFYRR